MMIGRRNVLKALGAGLFAGAARGLPAPQFPKDAVIRTVLKDIAPDELSRGATLFHEHLSLAPDFMPKWMSLARSLFPGRAGTSNPPPPPTAAPAAPPTAPPYFMRDAGLMAGELSAAAKDGVACIVDGGHPDMGRDLDFLKQISAKSGLPVVAGCGYYAQPFYPPEIATWSEDQIAAELIRQARTQPVGALGEIGTWDVMTADERKVFRAVARTHLDTNLAIFTHTNFGKGALEQLDLLESAGVKPERVAIGHVGGLNEPTFETVKAIAQRGAYVGIDR